jgi:hypothetical protein
MQDEGGQLFTIEQTVVQSIFMIVLQIDGKHGARALREAIAHYSGVCKQLK